MFYEDLTKLCSTAGWFDGNIGVKFLIIMRYTTQLEHKTRVIPESEYTKYILYMQVAK